MTDKILLGHKVPSGERFYIPLGHTVFTGMTALAGKTTGVKAIAHRLPQTSDCPFKILVFLTKRGEKVFADTNNANVVVPFYRERFDWEYVRGLLEATWHERLKFETPWIIRICKMAAQELRGREDLSPGEGLRVVRQLLGKMLTSEKLRDFDRNIYTTLAAYMDKVLPTLEGARQQFADQLKLLPGINVMDLIGWYTHEEVQMLVIRACMEEILKSGVNVVVALPEAWKMLPQGRNTPVKLFFEKFIREGATNGCYLIIDAQDLGGVDKSPLRQVSVWIMGRMQEANEVERLLKQTLGLAVPVATIQTLPLGHFLVACGDVLEKVYVWPHGIAEEMSVDVAKGLLKPEVVQERLARAQSNKEVDDLVYKEMYEKMKQERDGAVQKLEEIDKDFKKQLEEVRQAAFKEAMKKVEEIKKELNVEEYQNTICELKDKKVDLEAELKKLEPLKAFGAALQNFLLEIGVMTPNGVSSEVDVSVQPTLTKFTVKTPKREFLEATDQDVQGQILMLAAKGWFDEHRKIKHVRDELYRVYNVSPRLGTVETLLRELTAKGVLQRDREENSWVYWLAPRAKELIRVEET
jgi:hypothetical protein